MRDKTTFIGSPDEMAEEASSASSLVPNSQDKQYEAYRIKLRVNRLKIRRSGKGKESPAYRDLLHVRSNDDVTCFELIFRYLIVRVYGKNLGEVIDAIENHVCDFILEYQYFLWLPPAENKPIIEKIEIPVEDQDKGKEAA